MIFIRNDSYSPTITRYQHVIAHLLMILWMVGLKEVYCCCFANHRFMQNDHRGFRLEITAPFILLDALSVI